MGLWVCLTAHRFVQARQHDLESLYKFCISVRVTTISVILYTVCVSLILPYVPKAVCVLGLNIYLLVESPKKKFLADREHSIWRRKFRKTSKAIFVIQKYVSWRNHIFAYLFLHYEQSFYINFTYTHVHYITIRLYLSLVSRYE